MSGKDGPMVADIGDTVSDSISEDSRSVTPHLQMLRSGCDLKIRQYQHPLQRGWSHTVLLKEASNDGHMAEWGIEGDSGSQVDFSA